MRASLNLVAAAVVFGLTLAKPARRDDCKVDQCARAVGSASQALPDCSSFLEFTVLHTDSTITTTVTPTAPATETSFIATVTRTESIVSESLWPTTINTEIPSGRDNLRRAEVTCTPAETLSPSALPDYATSACSNDAHYSSVCSCAGVTAQYTSFGCYAFYSTVTAPPTATITQFATSTYTQVAYITTTLTTPLVNDIRCDEIIPIDEDLPAYVIRCEAEGVGDRTLIGTLDNTDWDNCVEEATFGLSATDWEFDLDTRACRIYDKYNAGNRNGTQPRKNYVYAYIYE